MSRSGSSSGGTNPTPPPSIRCVPGRPAREHRRLGRLDRHASDAGEPLAQRPADAHEAAGGADVRDPCVDAAVQLLEDLLAHGAIAGRHVVVLELVGADSRRSRRRSRAPARASIAISCGVIPSGLGTTSSVAPNARMVASFSSANASDVTIRVG